LSISFVLVLLCQTVCADEKTHYVAARQFVDMTYKQQIVYDSARKSTFIAVRDKFDNDPETKPYSKVLTDVIMDVLDAYFHDPETQDRMKTAIAKIYMEEFTEYELKEFIRFYGTPAGQKALQRLPVVMQKGGQAGSEIGRQVSSSPKYQQMMAKKVKELQDKGKLPREVNERITYATTTVRGTARRRGYEWRLTR
jgi:hypothetical protein